MERKPTRSRPERATSNDELLERDAQAEVNDLMSMSLKDAEQDLADVASELAQDGVRPEDTAAGRNLDDPLSTERRGLDVFHANELSGIDTGANFQPASTTDRFGGAAGTGRDDGSDLGGDAFEAAGSSSNPLGPGFDTSLGGGDMFDNDDYDGSPDGSAPSLPGQATDDPSTMASDSSGGALDDAILQQQVGGSDDDGQAAMREGVREAVRGMTGTSDRDTLERVSALQGAGLDGEVSEADQARMQELLDYHSGTSSGASGANSDDDSSGGGQSGTAGSGDGSSGSAAGGADGGAGDGGQSGADDTTPKDDDQTYSPMDMDTSPGRLRTNDDQSPYLNETPTDIDVSFVEAAQQLARAQGPGIGTLIDIPMEGTGNDLGGLNIEEAREDIDPLDPDAE